MEFQTIAKKSTNLCLALGENHITEKQTLAFCQLKATNWSAENFKKALNLSELAPEPVIRSCGSGQRIPCFDSCQLTIIWMSIIALNTGYRHFTLVFLWCGRTYGHVMTKISQLDRLLNFLRYGSLLTRAWSSAEKTTGFMWFGIDHDIIIDSFIQG